MMIPGAEMKQCIINAILTPMTTSIANKCSNLHSPIDPLDKQPKSSWIQNNNVPLNNNSLFLLLHLLRHLLRHLLHLLLFFNFRPPTSQQTSLTGDANLCSIHSAAWTSSSPKTLASTIPAYSTTFLPFPGRSFILAGE